MAFVVFGYVLELHLVPAIVLVEAIIAKRILAVSFGKSLLVAAAANAASALVGLLLVLPATLWLSVRESLESGAFLVILLCLPLCLASIPIESRVVAFLLRRSHAPPQCRRWSREANTASYLMVAGVSLAILGAAWIYRNRGLI